MANDQRVRVGGRELTVSNLDKVLYPATEFTKGQVLDYYTRAAPVLLEAGGVLTLADGSPMFPVTTARRDHPPVAVLAGNPTSHAQALAEVTASTVSR